MVITKHPIVQHTNENLAPPRDVTKLNIAYIMSRFPKLSETFVLYEMLALQQQGVGVEVFPLISERANVIHQEAQQFVERAHYLPVISWPILKAQFYFLRWRPAAYIGAWLEVLCGTFGSLNYMIGGLGIFPKAVRFAYDMSMSNVSHVHAHFANHPTVAALVIHRLLGIPFSFTAHAHDIYVDQHMLAQKVHAAAFVVAISDYNRELIVARCGEDVREKVIVLHCGVDTGVFQPAKKESVTGPFTIVCIGSLEEKKGQTYLIEACRLLKERNLDFICYLIGDGPMRSSLEEQIRRDQLEETVRLVGGRPRDEVVRMLSQADVVALPSIRTKSGKMEGIPVALMEPLACGVPVVSTRISGIPELVEDGNTGLLVPPKDAVALADALQRLANDPELGRRLGLAGREKVLREFDLSNNTARLAQLIIGGMQ